MANGNAKFEAAKSTTFVSTRVSGKRLVKTGIHQSGSWLAKFAGARRHMPVTSDREPDVDSGSFASFRQSLPQVGFPPQTGPKLRMVVRERRRKRKEAAK